MALTGAKGLLRWSQQVTEEYDNVNITNMTTSWRDGLAFCAILHHFSPDSIDYYRLSKENVAENNSIAFTTAEREFGIPSLLDVEDMVSMSVPDKLSIMTYLSQYYAAFKDKVPAPKRVGKQSPPKRPVEWKTDDRPPKKQAGQKSQSIPGLTAAKEVIGSPPKASFGTATHSCAACGKPVYLMERLNAENKVFHRICFKCSVCSTQLRPTQYRYIPSEKKFYCDTHYRSRTISTGSDDGVGQSSGSIPGRLRNLSFGRKTKQENVATQEGKIGNGTIIEEHRDEERSYRKQQTPHYETPYLYGRFGKQHNVDIYDANTSESLPKETHKENTQTPVPTEPDKKVNSVLSSAIARSMDSQNQSSKPDLTRIRSTEPKVPSQFRLQRALHKGDDKPEEYENPVYGQSIQLQQDSYKHGSPLAGDHDSADVKVDTSGVARISSNPFITSDKKTPGSSPQTVRGRLGTAEKRHSNETQHKEGKKKLVLKVKKKKEVEGTNVDVTDQQGDSNKSMVIGGQKVLLRKVTPPARPPVSDEETPNKIISSNHALHKSDVDKASIVSNRNEQSKSGVGLATGNIGYDDSKSWAPTYNRSGSKEMAKSKFLSNGGAMDASPSSTSQHLEVKGEKKKKLVLKVKKGSLRGQPKSSSGFQSYVDAGNKDDMDCKAKDDIANKNGKVMSQSPRERNTKNGVPMQSGPKKSPHRPPPPRAESVEHLGPGKDAEKSHNGVSSYSQGDVATQNNYSPFPESGKSKSVDHLNRDDIVHSGNATHQQSSGYAPPRPRSPYESNMSKSVGNLVNVSGKISDFNEPNMNAREKSPGVPTSPANRNISPVTSRMSSSTAVPPKPARGEPRKSSAQGSHLFSKKPRGRAPSLDLEEKKLTKEEMQAELIGIEKKQRDLELRGVEMEKMLRETLQGEPEEEYLIDWFNLVTEKNRLLRRENELIYVLQEQDYFQNQKAVEAELRRLMEKEDRKKTSQDRKREDELLQNMLMFVSKRSSIIEKLEEDRLREREEDAQIEMMMQAQGLTKEKRERMGPKSTFYC